MDKETILNALAAATRAGDPEELLVEATVTRATLLLLPGYAELEAHVRQGLEELKATALAAAR